MSEKHTQNIGPAGIAPLPFPRRDQAELGAARRAHQVNPVFRRRGSRIDDGDHVVEREFLDAAAPGLDEVAPVQICQPDFEACLRQVACMRVVRGGETAFGG